MKQASREWHLTIAEFLKFIGFQQLLTDSCVFHIITIESRIIIILYVDDFIVLATHMQLIENLFTNLSTQYVMKQKPLTECLGFKVDYNQQLGRLSISRNDYLLPVLKKYGHFIADRPFTAVPFPPSVIPSRSTCPQEHEVELKQQMALLPYRELTGVFNYFNSIIRADISLAVNLAARYMDNPGPDHWDNLLHLFAYLRDHPVAFIAYGNGIRPDFPANRLIIFVDSDWARDPDTRQSTSGWIVYFNGGIISWKTYKQKTVSGSSTEAEYKACYDACVEGIGLYRILIELGFTHEAPILVYEDNSSTIRASQNPVEQSKLRHIETKFHNIRDFVSQKLVVLAKVESAHNHADAFTKPLGPTEFHFHAQHYLDIVYNARLDLNYVSQITVP